MLTGLVMMAQAACGVMVYDHGTGYYCHPIPGYEYRCRYTKLGPDKSGRVAYKMVCRPVGIKK